MINIFLRTVCDEFAARYGRPDSQFPCFYSQIDPQRVITELDFQEVRGQTESRNINEINTTFSQISDTLVYGVTIPCGTFCLSVIYLVIAYIHIYPRQVSQYIESLKSMNFESSFHSDVFQTSNERDEFVLMNQIKKKILLLLIYES